MPIRRHLRYLYPIDWKELSLYVRFVRAKGRCERYGRPHGKQIAHLGDGRWWDEALHIWRSGTGRTLKFLPPLDDTYFATDSLCTHEKSILLTVW